MNDESRHPPEGEPSEEEIRRQIEEQLKQLRVEDVLLQTVVTLVNLTGRKLTVAEEKDLGQAKTGIESVRALLPFCPEDQVGPVRDALSQLQMLFARESQQPARAEETPTAEEKPSAREDPSAEDEERARARAKLWTPPGSS